MSGGGGGPWMPYRTKQLLGLESDVMFQTSYILFRCIPKIVRIIMVIHKQFAIN